MKNDYSNAALLLVGHGSTVNADSAKPVYLQAEALRRRGVFARVVECFWKQEPLVRDALDEIEESNVFIVPLFISEGYFTIQAIPEALEFKTKDENGAQGLTRPTSRIIKRGDQTCYYCKPIGTHQSMTEVLLARARKIVEEFPFPKCPDPAKTSLFIAGHGTERDANSRKAIEDQARQIRERNLYADVHAVFIEESPQIKECYTLAETNNIVVVPFFISDGMHTKEDIPVMLGAVKGVVEKRLAADQTTWRNPTEKNGKLVWLTRSIGSEPTIADVILERVEEAVSET